MNRVLVLAAWLLFAATFATAGVGRLDPRLARVALDPAAAPADVLYKSDGGFVVRAVLTFNGDLEPLHAAGARIVCRRGRVAVVDIPPAELARIADLPNVVYLEAPPPSRPMLDKSTIAVNAVRARNERGITGRGVLVGIIDSGIDWRHADFRRPDGKTRIKAMLDLSTRGNVYGGTTYNEQQINEALAGRTVLTMNDLSGHGTHVASIAAGDGAEGGGFGLYAGVAPEADLIVVKATRDLEGREFHVADQIIGLTFIDSIATLLKKPYVANMSLGGHSGAHDGTSPVERFIDDLIGPGKAVVTVAGNDGDRAIHAQIGLSGSASYHFISFNVESYTLNPGSGNDQIVMDGWYDGQQKVGITVMAPSGREYGPVLPGSVYDKKTTDGTIYVWNGFYEEGEGYRQGVNPFNGDREFYIQIWDEMGTPPPEGEWKLIFSGSGGTVDVWLVDASMEVEFVRGAVPTGKLSIPGTSRSAITVASFVTKRSWEDLDGNRLTYDTANRIKEGQLSLFSSPGPIRKGDYVKPDLAAPGQIIVAAFSSEAPSSAWYSIFNSGDSRYPNAYINRDGAHGLSSGTSMAAPHVAGAVALLLQQDPTLTSRQIKSILTAASRADAYVGSVPNYNWGWGKLDVLNVLITEPPNEVTGRAALLPSRPNPFVGQTEILFELPTNAEGLDLSITIFNAAGRRVRRLLPGSQRSGINSLYWDGREDSGSAAAAGVYFVEMQLKNWRAVRKIVYLGSSQ